MLKEAPLEINISLNHTRISKRSDGILEMKCGDDVCYEVTHFKEILRSVEEMWPNEKHPSLFLVGEFTSISMEARKFGATKEATVFSKAEAYVIRSLAQRLIGNFYLNFDKPPVPTKFFSNKKAAEIWLRSFS